jgi:leader peptidase (prepilin peptidase)/N-methyltransferase
MCPVCGTVIRARDNIPVVSWLLLRGRCRGCHARISPVYPLTELATGMLFVGASVVYDNLGVAMLMAAFFAVLVAVSEIDLRERIIPNRIVYAAAPAAAVAILAIDLAGGGLNLSRALLGTAIFGGGLLVIALIAPRGMGMGDVKLAALIGLVVGSVALSRVAVAAGVAILLGGVAAVIALLLGRGRKTALPFGPFLAAGAAVAVLAGAQIARAYLSLLT